ncbi:alpha-2-macroglobulin domain protein 2 (plasmid) [Gemmatirosa kalamazoonensis]|uniref:Alpha-2-macroglobulin domain protein 2 n=1 Tax=Gemmatirosa kalamazoonensis TaxID=861299 RepID=W0RS18_9BACT|nr:Ig-like domain-containing alpha-2-macroglobulin family protein [Gemmatirosa kalamazoonensis]AHG93764.1 alpha-2-macroglobulin domain protein 2 [Gemmatirosa kalamazoonensis]
MRRRFALLALVAAQAHAQPAAPLRVIRATPAGDAAPSAEIAVTFDRPVAGSLDRTVDPATVLRVEPAVRGRLEWRDPVTVRLVPSEMLAPGTRYAVTVSTAFRAMDGSALAEPYRFSFRAQGPTLLGGSPVAADDHPRVTTTQRFELVYSAPVDLEKLSGAAFAEFRASCAGGRRIVRLRAAAQRRVRDDDPWRLREAGGYQRDHKLDSLRRVVQLAPESAMPRGCVGDLVVPAEIEDERLRDPARWPFETYGDFRVATVECGGGDFCPTGPLRVTFATPVRGAEVLRRVKLLPAVPFAVRDTASESTTWTLEGRLVPHTVYAVVVDTAMRDVFGQPLRGNPAAAYRTTGYAPSVTYAYGRLLVERAGFRTLAVQHVNVDTLVATIAAVPDSLEARVLRRVSWGDDSVWSTLARRAVRQRVPLRAARDRAMLTGIRLPAPDATTRAPTLYAIKVAGRSTTKDTVADGPLALVQVTDLGVHTRLGTTEAAVWVTGVRDGLPRAGAAVTLFDVRGRRLGAARTDARGLARLTGLPRDPSGGEADDDERGDLEGFVTVTLGDDRAVASVSRYDPDLSPWRFDVSGAWGAERLPLAGAVFTERGIYRPGERVYAKAIVRDGALGSLRVPQRGDSVKWIFHDREDGVLRAHTAALSAFGTADLSVDVPALAPVGSYRVEIQARRQGQWQSFAESRYRVAEYRPPEFLVDLAADSGAKRPGDRLTVNVQARYLFGAPMARADVTWTARRTPVSSWELEIPGLDGWYVGDADNWWEDAPEPDSDVFASGVDTLDARGARSLTVTLPAPAKGRPARVTLDATVTDVNRQVVGASATALVHPADFYVAARPNGASYFWQGGVPQSVGVLAVRPNGEKVSGVRVRGAVVRREWHRVRRERDGVSELVGEWVADTVARCAITTAEAPNACAFTPKEGGIYVVSFTATDAAGRRASTSFQRWAAGKEWVPWSDETQFKMDVIPDRQRYSVGDTATVLFASPFTNAEAWITVEREGLIEQRRLRITSGSTTLKFPITEAYAPNAFVSIIVARGRSAPPGPVDDPGRPTIRVGYAELRVTPEVKRLAVAVKPLGAEYRPGDTARVALHVADARARGVRSEVTLWAVDEGVLALTAYRTPDPIDLVYQARGLGMRLASNMTNVAPQVPEGEKGKREAGGGGGAAGADVLRSRFQTTAFFLGSVVTDANGDAVATAKLPDNLTTFRVMAVAVTAGDRYGSGDASLLVTRPLLARQALPRFVRPGDEFVAGAVVNRRDGRASSVRVRATATGVALRGDAERTVTLAAGRGSDVRFPFRLDRRTVADDSATFRFDVSGDGDADAVRVALPVKPDYHPRAFVASGVLRDTATVDLRLPAGIDPARSRVTLTVGGSPLATIRGIARQLRVYPYDCTEQVTSEALPILALHRARPSDTTRREIARAVDVISRRQRGDGGIGYWSSTDWTSAWLSAYAGLVLVEARDAGVRVDSAVLGRLAAYVVADLKGTGAPQFTPVANRHPQRLVRLSDQVAAVDFLSRYGRPDAAAENSLLRNAAQLGTEDRARLAEVLARRGQLPVARRLLEPTWRLVQVEGRRAVLPESTTTLYFESTVRPVARLLTATLAVEPEHALIGPLVETLAQQGRATEPWNTQDYASAVSALAAYDRARRALGGDRPVQVRDARGRVALRAEPQRDSTVPLAGLLAGPPNDPRLAARLDAGAGDAPVYWYVTVTEVPTAPPVTPEDRGIQVERWYERYPAGGPVTRMAEGDLVRVRLRITVPNTRQFVVLDDALPAGLEAVDLSLRTASSMPGPGAAPDDARGSDQPDAPQWGYGRWDAGWWSPFDHEEIRDDRVVYSASVLWPGTYTATYIARATTAGTFVRPPAHAEEMYNPGVHGRSDGGTFVVTEKRP